MSFVHSEAKGDFAQGFQKSYVSTKAFNAEFYTYTASMNASFQNVGALTAVAGANSTNCPANRVLHLTGRKLVPGQHPNVSNMLVAVYDPVSFLNGFIDPSSSTFAKYDQNMPNSFNDGRNGGSVPPLGGQGAKVTVADAGVQACAVVTNAGSVQANNASCGQVSATGLTGGGVNTTATGVITISSTAVTPSSKIFLTPAAINTGMTLFVTNVNVAGGSFAVSVVSAPSNAVPAGGTAASFNWLVIN
jgi:hypothetical protein